MRKQLLEAVQATPDALDTSGPDGIIYVGGGKYWPGIVVGIRLLRRIGCTLPIQVWYRDGLEAVNPKDVAGCNVEFYGLKDEVLNDRRYGGWAAKLEAIHHTTFRRMLYLDADAYCVKDPTPLLSLLDSSSFVYWEDLPRQKKSINWGAIYPDTPDKINPVQGGQLLIDRIKAARLIHVARFLCRNHNPYFRFMYGDQDAWRVALNFDVATHAVIGPADWKSVAFVCQREGQPYIVHRCNGKLFRVKDVPEGRTSYNTYVEGLPLERDVFNLFAEVINAESPDVPSTLGHIIQGKLWGRGCGGGSRGPEAVALADEISKIIRKHSLRRVVDAGCGDGEIGRRLQAGEYHGCDVVPGPYVNQIVDIRNVDELPAADLLVSKDTVHHWPNEDVDVWLTSLIRSKKFRAILLVADEDETNAPIRDTFFGGYRPLRLTEYPLKDKGFMKVGKVAQKGFYLWGVTENGSEQQQQSEQSEQSDISQR